MELFERVHFDLFFVMLIFAAVALWLMLATFQAMPSPPRAQPTARVHALPRVSCFWIARAHSSCPSLTLMLLLIWPHRLRRCTSAGWRTSGSPSCTPPPSTPASRAASAPPSPTGSASWSPPPRCSLALPAAQWCVPSLTVVCTPHTPTPPPQVLHCQTQLEGGGNGSPNTGWLPNPWRRVVAYFRLIEAREQFKCACRARPHARPPLRAFLAASCRIARLTTAAAVAPCVCVCRAVPSILGAAQVHAAARSLRPYPAQRRRP